MKDDKWTKFVQTGSVYDYLAYTACTLEKSDDDRQDYGDGTGPVGDARGRVRQETGDSHQGTR